MAILGAVTDWMSFSTVYRRKLTHFQFKRRLFNAPSDGDERPPPLRRRCFCRLLALRRPARRIDPRRHRAHPCKCLHRRRAHGKLVQRLAYRALHKESWRTRARRHCRHACRSEPQISLSCRVSEKTRAQSTWPGKQPGRSSPQQSSRPKANHRQQTKKSGRPERPSAAGPRNSLSGIPTGRLASVCQCSAGPNRAAA